MSGDSPGEAAYLRSMEPWQAGQVMGSKARAQQVLDGASVDEVVNAGIDPAYRLARLGDGAGHALVTENAVMPHPTSDYTGQRPGLFRLPDLPINTLTGGEFGRNLSHEHLMSSANAALRAVQAAGGLQNTDTGWVLAVNKNGRKKMGDNARQTDVELKAIAGLADLVESAVVAERHPDDAHRNEFVVAIYRAYAPLAIGPEMYRVKLTIKEYAAEAGNSQRLLHALSAVEIENAPLGTFPASTAGAVLQPGQPTTGRTISVRDLLRGAQRQDGSPFENE